MRGRATGQVVLLGAVVAVVAGTVLTAVLVMDSPGEERAKRLDRQRQNDLIRITHAVDDYWREEGSLPEALEVLDGWQSYEVTTRDPETAMPYRYRATGARSYELCATFATQGEKRDPRPRYGFRDVIRRHSVGDQCFPLEAQDEPDR